MMSSQAYSLVLVKVKDGVDANNIAKTMSEKIDTRKWICVSAEKLYATSSNEKNKRTIRRLSSDHGFRVF